MTEPLHFIYQATARGHQRQMNQAQIAISTGRKMLGFMKIRYQLHILGNAVGVVLERIVAAFASIDLEKLFDHIGKREVKND